MKDLRINRRAFIKQAVMGSLGAAAYVSSGLRMVSAAATPGSDYKALVCVFLYGGNDSFNMFTPMTGASRQAYEDVRGNLARPLGLEVTPANMTFADGIAFDQNMSALRTLFNNGALAIQGNVGPLVVPMYNSDGSVNSNAKKPHGLYAHDGSQENWMRGADLNQKMGGWGGRMLDSWHNNNAVQEANFIRDISLGGTNTWQQGIRYSPYATNSDGFIETSFLTTGTGLLSTRTNAINNYRTNFSTSNRLQQAFFDLYSSAIDNNASLATQIAAVADSTVTYPATNLGTQLNTVAKLIEIGRANGVGRQIFFVGLGGFDTHKNQVNTHPALLTTLSEALASFYQDTQVKGIENEVTTFTMSEFGRSLRSNGDGTDHGWAGHQLILGGSVDGNKIYGDMPEQTVDFNLIPTTANEQMFASLATWFGVSQPDINELFPNLHQFNNDINYFRS
ncbi:DUF1501 domain-containing protein [Paraneptunicella aestuarii]|uniref:DUF1501 domain-containing protein n=1 Tax=Paraneptunicella aestuarii TaxID=2831148 RepID=UPI001E504176|nr:DUF1501 domain-containing protein [Paraneptunicella aestuarii]UAA37408.1 DUF1501 domain-containing protein [Paraneptunicella aestuarii]